MRIRESLIYLILGVQFVFGSLIYGEIVEKLRSELGYITISLAFNDIPNEEVQKKKDAIKNNPFNQCVVKAIESIDRCDFINAEVYLGELHQYFPDNSDAIGHRTYLKTILELKKQKIKEKNKKKSEFCAGPPYSLAICDYYSLRSTLHVDCWGYIDNIDRCWIFIMQRLLDAHTSNDEELKNMHLILTQMLIEIMIDPSLTEMLNHVDFTSFKQTDYINFDRALFFIMKCYTIYFLSYFSHEPEFVKTHLIEIINSLALNNRLVVNSELNKARQLFELEIATLYNLGLSQADASIVEKYIQLLDLSTDNIKKMKKQRSTDTFVSRLFNVVRKIRCIFE